MKKFAYLEEEFEFSSWLVFRTMLKKEIFRFLNVVSQTLLAPLLTASLYLLIFGVSLGSKISLNSTNSYLDFVLPGLILMGAINNSFANSSSSLFISRYIGNIVEILVTPMSHLQFLFSYVMASMIRGGVVAFLVWFVSLFFSSTPWAHPFHALMMLGLTTLIFSLLGVLAALVSGSFDTLSMFTNFLILPLIYLGGVFYPVSELPGFWKNISMVNPIYYLIEGFRYSYLGVGDLTFQHSLVGGGIVALVVFSLTYYVMYRGYKLRF